MGHHTMGPVNYKAFMLCSGFKGRNVNFLKSPEALDKIKQKGDANFK
jgi:hypothetical protein